MADLLPDIDQQLRTLAAQYRMSVSGWDPNWDEVCALMKTIDNWLDHRLRVKPAPPPDDAPQELDADHCDDVDVHDGASQ